MIKSQIDSLYDILASPEARQHYEDQIIQRLRIKLEYIHKRVRRDTANAAVIEKLQKESFSEQENAEKAFEAEDAFEPEGHISEAIDDYPYMLADHSKFQWTAVIALLQAIIGEDPDDDLPMDGEVITAVLAEQESWEHLLGEKSASPKERASGELSCRKFSDSTCNDGLANSNTESKSKLRQAIEITMNEGGCPGTDIHWKTFCARIWERCGVEPNARNCSGRTIRRIVAKVVS